MAARSDSWPLADTTSSLRSRVVVGQPLTPVPRLATLALGAEALLGLSATDAPASGWRVGAPRGPGLRGGAPGGAPSGCGPSNLGLTSAFCTLSCLRPGLPPGAANAGGLSALTTP